MRVITEATLRGELKHSKITTYKVPDKTILSPSAKEYLDSRKIKIVRGDLEQMQMNNYPEFKYIDYESKAYFKEKPEHMTQLYGNYLVEKSHPRIIFRGKLDTTQSLIVLTQCELKNEKIIDDLADVRRILSEIMRCEVLDETYKNEKIIGYTYDELRERSHEPQKFFGIKQMQLPHYDMGLVYAKLNHLRAEIRELETSANVAFCEEKEAKSSILLELNRLSSAVHIMMCKELAGDYA